MHAIQSQLLSFLESLWPPESTPSGYIAAFALPSEKSFFGRTPSEIAAAVEPYVGSQNLYLRATMVGAQPVKGRGSAADATYSGGVWVDIDVAGPAHSAANLPPTIDVAVDAAYSLGLDPSALVHTGNGIQAWWFFREPELPDADLVSRWQRGIAQASGWAIDNTADSARLMRLPGTFNRKDPANPKPVKFKASDVRYNPSDLRDLVSHIKPIPAPTIPAVSRSDKPAALFPIVEGCSWVRKCRDSAETLAYPDWYRMLGLLAACEEGRETAHEWSLPHPKYQPAETDLRFSQASEYGPPRCAYINTALRHDCSGCEHEGKITSPIVISRKTAHAIEPESWGDAVLSEPPPPLAPPPAPIEPDPTTSTARYGLNDTGNADRIVRDYGQDILHCECRNAFFIWQGNHWKIDRFVEIEKLAEKVMLGMYAEAAQINGDGQRKALLTHISKSLSRAGISNAAHVCRRKVRQIEPDELDKHPALLNFDNGTLNLVTGKLQPHRREDLISKCIPYAFDHTAKCPNFQRFLIRIMGGGPDATVQESELADRMIDYLQVLLGCAITGKPEKMIAIFWGGGNNGKTTLIETIYAALGGTQYAGQMQIDSLMAKAKDAAASNAIGADLADLQGCRFVSASEPEKGSRFSVARIKYLTGLTRIKARYLRENPFEFSPTHKLFIDCNPRPEINDPNDAVWNRVKLIPFTVTIPREEIDITLPDKLRAELPGIMAWLAQGAAKYLSRGIEDIPEVSAATEQYRKDSDKLTEFIEDNCFLGSQNWVAVTDLWNAYQNWSERERDRYPLSKSVFDERILRLGCRKMKKFDGKVRAWEGITILKSENGTARDNNSSIQSSNEAGVESKKPN